MYGNGYASFTVTSFTFRESKQIRNLPVFFFQLQRLDGTKDSSTILFVDMVKQDKDADLGLALECIDSKLNSFFPKRIRIGIQTRTRPGTHHSNEPIALPILFREYSEQTCTMYIGSIFRRISCN